MSNLVFPIDIAGALPNLRRKPMFSTGVQTAVSGVELRAAWQSFPRYKYTLSLEFLKSDPVYAEFQRVATAFCGTLGQYDTFLIVDPNDSIAVQTGFGVTDGSSTAFQLQRTLGGVQQNAYWDPQAYPINTLPRSNFLLQSQTINVTPWIASNVTIGVNAIPAPDGTLTADSLIESSSANVSHNIVQVLTGVPNNHGTAFTMSAYVFPGARTLCVLDVRENTGGSLVAVWFDLNAGTVGSNSVGANWSGVSATIAPAGNGWFRVTLTSNNTNLATSFSPSVGTAVTNGALGYPGTSSTVALYVWGVQFETGALAQSYLTTLTIPVRDDPAYWPNFGDGFEPVTEVNSGTLQIYLNNSLQRPGVDYNYEGSGLINFTSTPSNGLFLTWSGMYFRRVRFANDDLELERIFGQLWSGKTVEFISIK